MPFRLHALDVISHKNVPKAFVLDPVPECIETTHGFLLKGILELCCGMGASTVNKMLILRLEFFPVSPTRLVSWDFLRIKLFMHIIPGISPCFGDVGLFSGHRRTEISFTAKTANAAVISVAVAAVVVRSVNVTAKLLVDKDVVAAVVVHIRAVAAATIVVVGLVAVVAVVVLVVDLGERKSLHSPLVAAVVVFVVLIVVVRSIACALRIPALLKNMDQRLMDRYGPIPYFLQQLRGGRSDLKEEGGVGGEPVMVLNFEVGYIGEKSRVTEKVVPPARIIGGCRLASVL